MSDDLIFCGRNRVDKLEVLTDQHDTVARAAASAGPKAIPAVPGGGARRGLWRRHLWRRHLRRRGH
ncbi:hypothetical protein KAJ83_08495 [Marivibrio halodurans]|uniref:Uncharacterized protein n=1 Tax=Marivibrio halodurans TaxID=2039722 RepID=A0A8J7RYQ8_9PROT|nr:hypothetical protein [Marivibrio halodurans]MBP5857045.1 hypothetical protein [Marivibrio halodurans]